MAERLLEILTPHNTGELSQLLVKAQAEGRKIKLIRLSDSEGVEGKLSKKYHDVSNAIRTFRFAVDALKDGYRFADASSEKKISTIEEAVGVLEGEMELLRSLYVTQP